MLETARVLATLDVLAALAEVAAANDYTKPRIHHGDELVVIDGRHPVVENAGRATRSSRTTSTSNATTHQLIVLTGPNMGGKSTYLRQAALISVMAQAGSFVPAKQAKLPIIDRVFARVGRLRQHRARPVHVHGRDAGDRAHPQPGDVGLLVVLDEIGRGTATFDGLSIAWAVAEHLATNPRARPKTLFATHYHELTDLADALPGVVNYHVAVREWHDDIVFLRKVLEGRSDRSYGIQVARLAGLPPAVVARARDILGGLERDELSRGGRPSMHSRTEAPQQLGLFQAAAPAQDHRERLREVDVNDDAVRAAVARSSERKTNREPGRSGPWRPGFSPGRP